MQCPEGRIDTDDIRVYMLIPGLMNFQYNFFSNTTKWTNLGIILSLVLRLLVLKKIGSKEKCWAVLRWSHKLLQEHKVALNAKWQAIYTWQIRNPWKKVTKHDMNQNPKTLIQEHDGHNITRINHFFQKREKKKGI